MHVRAAQVAQDEVSGHVCLETGNCFVFFKLKLSFPELYLSVCSHM